MSLTELAELALKVDAATPATTLPSPDERRALRRAAGLTIDVAAALAGAASWTYSEWERGAREPRLSGAHRYGKLLTVCKGRAIR